LDLKNPLLQHRFILAARVRVMPDSGEKSWLEFGTGVPHIMLLRVTCIKKDTFILFYFCSIHIRLQRKAKE